MAVSPGFRDYVIEQLAYRLPVRDRRMFGGIGIYADDLFFAIIADDALYFKVDPVTQHRYVEADSTRFRPWGDERSLSYYAVPAGVLEDPDELCAWALEALDVARRSRSA